LPLGGQPWGEIYPQLLVAEPRVCRRAQAPAADWGRADAQVLHPSQQSRQALAGRAHRRISHVRPGPAV